MWALTLGPVIASWCGLRCVTSITHTGLSCPVKMPMPDLEAVVIPESNQLAQDQSHGEHYTQEMIAGSMGMLTQAGSPCLCYMMMCL